ncbi:phosphotransferase enzyme family protein [Acidaminobacter sp. JC074]|uniref:phosphotransferase enzyme family protein n=1 Tax=Acidaminobacter sp. JC074 TaxID=2530199 RepID=UPI001F10F54A|nr:phosphotransferase [Acidaminobacter sp. JC074]
MELNKYRDIALSAINMYDFKSSQIEFLVEETNVIYKVHTKEGDYALKIFEEASSCLEDNKAEAYFLDLVDKKTNLSFPKLVKNKEGCSVTSVYCDSEDIYKRIMIYKWMAGKDHDKRESIRSFETLGETLAKLHEATFGEALHDLKPKRWNKVFFYKDEVAVYHKIKYENFIDKELKRLLDKIIPILNESLDKIYCMYDSQLIHGDLNPWNIKVSEDDLFLIDYEEAMLGCPLHDLATLLYYYTHHNKWSYDEVKDAFIRGYHRLREFDFNDDLIEDLIIARRVNFINYVLIIRENPRDFINKSVPLLKAYLNKRGLYE